MYGIGGAGGGYKIKMICSHCGLVQGLGLAATHRDCAKFT